jgi:mercuric reductase
MPDAFDLIVLGAGSAAREAARHAATHHGASVAIVERELWGGQCPNVACKPTKQYTTAGDLLHDLRAADDLGLDVGPVTFDLARLKARKDWLVGPQAVWRQRFVDAGYEAIDAAATFLDARTVRVGDRELTSDHILIATGSRTALPPVEGLEDVPWLDHISLLELTAVPESLLVLGAGAVGLELGQCFARFGAKVTIVQSDSRVAVRADADASAAIEAALRDEGIEIVVSTYMTEVARDGEELVATLTPRNGGAPRQVRAAQLLLATGRNPNIEELALDRAGVEHDRRGIAVDERMRTNVPGIWAVGDATATVQLTPVAGIQGQVAIADMFGDGKRTIDYDLIPASIFTDPEVAGVGLSEAEAVAAGFAVGTSRYDTASLVRPYYTSTRDESPHGFVKLVFERGAQRRLLGVHAVMRGGAELLQGFAVALKLGATVDDVAFAHYAFPTYGEGLHYAAEESLAAALTS